MSNDLMPPTERRIPSPAREEILRRVLAGEVVRPRERSWTAPLAAAAALAAVVGGVSLWGAGGPGTVDAPAPADSPSVASSEVPSPSPSATPTASPAATPTGPVNVDVGVLDAADAARSAKQCVRQLGPASSEVTALYAVEQRWEWGSKPVIAAQEATGRVVICEHDGASDLGKDGNDPLPLLAPGQLVEQISGAGSGFGCNRKGLESFQTAAWYVADDQVATLRLRLVLDGEPQPWHVTEVRDGLGHIRAWMSGQRPRGTRVSYQTELLDASGNVLERLRPVDEGRPCRDVDFTPGAGRS